MTGFAPGIASAILAALLFGASTPFAKRLVGEVPPQILAGLLYLGSGVGLAAVLAVRGLFASGGAPRVALPTGREWGWLAGAILFGGVIGPVLLMVGLVVTPASITSLLLNLEAVFTALLAWFVFRENFNRRIAVGMALIVAGGVVLAWQPQGAGPGPWGALAVAGACACWALDNNLTRKVSASDAVLIACIKGLAAGAVNVCAAVLAGQAFPGATTGALAALLGFFGYGVSLVLFVVALRHLGTARTGAYFSVAPFFGAVLAVVLLGEPASAALTAGGVLMAAGVWLHITERHEHTHEHEPIEHEHLHAHDEHHQHPHEFAWDGNEPHVHRHRHAPLRHKHLHYPDIHHQHRH
jgi:drug/metabolite transporter (DMT)-like permease